MITFGISKKTGLKLDSEEVLSKVLLKNHFFMKSRICLDQGGLFCSMPNDFNELDNDQKLELGEFFQRASVIEKRC